MELVVEVVVGVGMEVEVDVKVELTVHRHTGHEPCWLSHGSMQHE